MNDHRTYTTGGGVIDEEDFREKERYVGSNFWNKMDSAGNKLSFAKDLYALFRYLSDRYVTWQRKAVVVLALIYFISPIDTIPDLAPLFGYLDDLGVITAVLKFMGHELVPYYKE